MLSFPKSMDLERACVELYIFQSRISSRESLGMTSSYLSLPFLTTVNDLY